MFDVCLEELPANPETVDEFTIELLRIINDKKLKPEKNLNLDETSLNLKHLHKIICYSWWQINARNES